MIPRAALPGNREKVPRVVESIHVVASLGEQMRVTSLTARHVKHPGSSG